MEPTGGKTGIEAWTTGVVDRSQEHFEIRCGSGDEGASDDSPPVALVGSDGSAGLVVEFTTELEPEMAGKLRDELKFYLSDLQEEHRWAYLRYHCTTAANLYSPMHWSCIEPRGDRGTQESGGHS